MKRKKRRESSRERKRRKSPRTCRNYRDKIHQNRNQSQRPTRGFFSDQAIFCCCVFPCLAIPLHIRTSVCVSKEKEQHDRVQSQRPRGGFPSAQAIFFCPVLPCLAILIHFLDKKERERKKIPKHPDIRERKRQKFRDRERQRE